MKCSEEFKVCKLSLPLLLTTQVERHAITAGTVLDFGFGAVEVVGYQYNITFVCANGNVPTLYCNTRGTSPFTSTNEDLNALKPPEGRQCVVTSEIDGSIVSGEYSLSVSYPHKKQGIPEWNYSTEPLSWRATADDLDSTLEAIKNKDGARVFGAVTVERHVYWPPGAYKWSGQYNWSVTFETRQGDVPQMKSNSSMASNNGNAAVSVGTARDGNEINGGFGLSFCPSRENCKTTSSSYFSSQLTEDEMKYRFSQAFFTRGSVTVNVSEAFSTRVVKIINNYSDTAVEESDWLRFDGNDYTVESVDHEPTDTSFGYLIVLATDVLSDKGVYVADFGTTAVSVTRNGPMQAMGYSWEVTFSNKTVGGDQPDVVSTSDELTGSGVDVIVWETQQGNQLTGTFTLSYNGETTSEIPFDGSAASVQSAVNSLSSVYPSRVDVSRTEEIIDRSQQVGGYTWTIVFDSDTWHDPTDHSFSESYIDGSWVGDPATWEDTWPSTGAGRFPKVWGRNVGLLPDMDCSSDGLGTTRRDGSEDCKVCNACFVSCSLYEYRNVNASCHFRTRLHPLDDGRMC